MPAATSGAAPRATRRAVLAGAAALAAGPVLAACGADDPGGSNGAGAPTGPATVPVADVPVGGGMILSAHSVVVTQPTQGQFKAFSAICTHQGCLVSRVVDAHITCPCHNSSFSITDGSVQSGPAPRPLDGRAVNVAGGTLTVT